jgi:hypothetical protein
MDGKDRGKEKDKSTPLNTLPLAGRISIFLQQNLSFITFISLSISVAFYAVSLRGCHNTQAECLKELNEGEVRFLLKLLATSSFIIASIINLTLRRIIPKKMIILLSLAFGYLCLYHDIGSDLAHHGAYNRMLLLILTILFIFIQNLGLLIYKGLRRAPFLTLAAVGWVIVLGLYFYYYKMSISCQDWTLGLKGTRINLDDMPCKLHIPKVCWHDLVGDYFDYSKILGEHCSIIRNGDRSFFDQHLKKRNTKYNTTNLIGFPRVENFTYDQSLHGILAYQVMKNVIDMENPHVPKSKSEKVEITVDYSGTESQLKINLKKDEDRIREQQPLYKSKGRELMSKNLMVIFIDSLSRRQFFRKMPKTKAWVEQFYDNQSDKNRKFSTYQFLKFHDMGPFTQINTMPGFFGSWWLKAGGTFFTQPFIERGAIIGQSVNQCAREQFDLENDHMRYFPWEYTDHENHAMFCDPNYNQADNPYTPFLGPYSIRRRCLHGKDTHDYNLEYAKQFWETYQDMPKVFRMSFMDSHEGTGNVVKYLDSKLEHFLVDLEQKKLLDDTIIVLMSDHGSNMPGFLSFSEDSHIEKFLPTFFLILPKEISEKYHKNLKHNEQKLVVPWDLHNTLLQIGGAEKTKYNDVGISLFEKITNSRFNCRGFGIRDDYCVCTEEKKKK